MLGNNAIQLVFTVLFAHLLGSNGYGSLTAIVAGFLIVLVSGQAVQVAAAREVALGRLGEGHALAATLSKWTRTLLIATAVAVVIGALGRNVMASIFAVPKDAWGAGALVPTLPLWLLVSVQRGVLQGMRAYKPVGLSIIFEGTMRLACSLVMFEVGAGVSGAYFGTPLSFVIVSIVLAVVARRRIGLAHKGPPGERLRELIVQARVPIIALTPLAVLLNVDVILARRQLGHIHAGHYSAAAVSAKAVAFVAIGIALYVLPEATRRAAAGIEPRPVLFRALGVLVVAATPALLIFAFGGSLLLGTVFGSKLDHGSSYKEAATALAVLGPAMALIGASSVAVQYMLALGKLRFLWVLYVMAAIEPVVLTVGHFNVTSFAVVVLGIQSAAAAGLLLLAIRARPAIEFSAPALPEAPAAAPTG